MRNVLEAGAARVRRTRRPAGASARSETLAPSFRGSRLTASALALGGLLGGLPVQAIEFGDGEFRGSLDTTISHGLTFRVERRDPELAGRHQRQRRQPELRPRRGQQHLEVHHRSRRRHRRLRRVRAGHRIHRLRERERDPGAHPAARCGEGPRGQESRVARRLRHRHVRRRGFDHRRASRPTRAQLGREHLHPQRHQRHQPLRREQAQAAGLRAARGAAAGRFGVDFRGTDRHPVGGGVLPARLGGDRDRSGRQLLLVHRLRGTGSEKGGDLHCHGAPVARQSSAEGPGIRVRSADAGDQCRSRGIPGDHPPGNLSCATTAPAAVRPGLRVRAARRGPYARRLRPVGTRNALPGRGPERYRVRLLLHELSQPTAHRRRTHLPPGGRPGGSRGGRCSRYARLRHHHRPCRANHAGSHGRGPGRIDPSAGCAGDHPDEGGGGGRWNRRRPRHRQVWQVRALLPRVSRRHPALRRELQHRARNLGLGAAGRVLVST